MAAYTLLTLFLCTTLTSCRGDGAGMLQALDPTGYVDRVVAALEAGVRAHGLSNLPVQDANMTLNRTVYGVRLLGVAHYTAGFVMETGGFRRDARHLQTGVRGQTAYLQAEVSVPDLALLYNLRVGNVSGTALHTFPTNQIAVHICYNLTSQVAEVAHMYPSSVSGPRTEYSPDTNVTRAVARVARLRASTVLWEDLKNWIAELFIPIVNSTVTEMHIPFGVIASD